MAKEVNYIVANSGFGNRIFAGTTRTNKNGVGIWITRKDVTDMAHNCVLRHLVEKVRTDYPTSDGVTLVYEGVEGYTIEMKFIKE